MGTRASMVGTGIGGEDIRPETRALMANLLAFAKAMTPRQREILTWLRDHSDSEEGTITRQGLVAHLGTGYRPIASRTVSLLLRNMAIEPINDGHGPEDSYQVFQITDMGERMIRGEIAPDSEWR